MLCPVCQTENAPDATTCVACGTPLELAGGGEVAASPALAAGTKLARGAFVLDAVLGEGGFGITYRASETALARQVAVKEFFPFGSTRDGGKVRAPSGVGDEEWKTSLEAFRQEALSLARFNHPAIVRAYAVWAENGTAYFAMEFLRGQSLQKRLDGGQPLPLDEALEVVESIGAALEKVHEAGFLHRDIKPDNILLCEGRAVLIDFGTARAFAGDRTTPMTQLLTPGYAPLEQYGRRARFGPFTDVYALAATLYHALAGHAPPPATDRANGVELRPLDQENRLVSPHLARAVGSALELPVIKRPQTVGAWLQLLRDAQKPLPTPKVPPPLAPAVLPTPVVPPPSNPVPVPQPRVSPPQNIAPVPVATSPVAPRKPPQPSAPDVSYKPEIAPDARTPRWVLPTLILVPVVLLGWWLFYDPSRADIRAFDTQTRPIWRETQAAQGTFADLNRTTLDAFVADAQARALPPQQAIVGEVESLAPQSDEALFSRDQLLDAERERLDALSALANIAPNQNITDAQVQQDAALEQLRHADDQLQTWRDDFAYLKSQHRLGR